MVGPGDLKPSVGSSVPSPTHYLHLATVGSSVPSPTNHLHLISVGSSVPSPTNHLHLISVGSSVPSPTNHLHLISVGSSVPSPTHHLHLATVNTTQWYYCTISSLCTSPPFLITHTYTFAYMNITFYITCKSSYHSISPPLPSCDSGITVLAVKAA